MLNQGVFLLSLDTELAWGGMHNCSFEQREHLYAGTRRAIKELIGLLERYEVQATWAVVGHLLLESCKPQDGVKHPELVRPDYTWFSGDWLADDPCTDAGSDPYWYAPDIVEDVLACSVPQEIGCHGFSHMIAADPGCSAECFESEIRASLQVASRRGLTLKSFVFPRNAVAHLDVLARYGFTAFRGVVPAGRNYRRLPGPLKKIANGARWSFPLLPLTAEPSREEGMWNLPATSFYMHRMSAARLVPIRMRVHRAIRGIDLAVRQRSTFHMYFHPFNLASDPEGLLGGLGQILRYVRDRRDDGVLQTATMGELADRLDETRLSERELAV